ncbi:MAG: hypothetical protein R3F59_02975 [Myxococcota bacterium]
MADAARGWLTRERTVGSPVRWAGHGALAGAMVPLSLLGLLTALQLAVPPWFLVQAFLGLAAVGAAVGGAVGLVEPVLMDRLRGRAGLPAIVCGQAALGALASAAGWVGYTTWNAGVFDPVMLWFAAVAGAAGAATMLVGWLPVTVAVVTRHRAWPITVASSVVGATVASVGAAFLASILTF